MTCRVYPALACLVYRGAVLAVRLRVTVERPCHAAGRYTVRIDTLGLAKTDAQRARFRRAVHVDLCAVVLVALAAGDAPTNCGTVPDEHRLVSRSKVI